MMSRLQELGIPLGSFQPENLDKVYKKRWRIEVLFQNFKNRGFN
jgi:hypothetical protein